MPRYIDADALMDWIIEAEEADPDWCVNPVKNIFDHIEELPPADVVEVKHGKWIEKEVIHKEEAKDIIEEWQTCNCSVCGRYDTRPYLYFFDEPRFCSWCGADMRKETGDGQNDINTQ